MINGLKWLLVHKPLFFAQASLSYALFCELFQTLLKFNTLECRCNTAIKSHNQLLPYKRSYRYNVGCLLIETSDIECCPQVRNFEGHVWPPSAFSGAHLKFLRVIYYHQ